MKPLVKAQVPFSEHVVMADQPRVQLVRLPPVSTNTFLALLASLRLANSLLGQESNVPARCVGVTDGFATRNVHRPGPNAGVSPYN